MAEWVRSVLDLVLIGVVCAGLVQATRLLGHLVGFRKSRLEMERFVHDFGTTVTRAEAGIQNLKQAAREGGDDLEKLIERAGAVKEEMIFICESADQLAERLTQAAGNAARSGSKATETARPVDATKAAPAEVPRTVTAASTRKEPSSRAEKELMQALKKLS